jgi:hypothetical protein
LPDNHSETGTWQASAPTVAVRNAALYDFEAEANITMSTSAYAGPSAAVTVELYQGDEILWSKAGDLGERVEGTAAVAPGSYRVFAFMSLGAAAPYDFSVTFSA